MGQMKEQQDEEELKGKLMRSLEATNFILGDSEITASRFTDSLQAQDFDECSHEGHHDCSEFAEFINERGTYRCQCRSGFVDSADETGRICLAEREECGINLKVVMIVVLAFSIFLILLVTAI